MAAAGFCSMVWKNALMLSTLVVLGFKRFANNRIFTLPLRMRLMSCRCFQKRLVLSMSNTEGCKGVTMA